MEESSCVVEGLYLGGVLAALNERDLTDKGITHILSVDEHSLPKDLAGRFVYKHIYALDIEECDLLSCFTETSAFIEEGRSAGGQVLVHCQAGMSRSATVVCAYLMQKLSMGKDQALRMILANRPSVSPNPGFQEQLDLFEAMGCRLTKTHPKYRAWQLSKLADRFQGGPPASGGKGMDVLAGLLLETDFSWGGNDSYYKCRKCRMKLFRHGAVTSHSMGRGEKAFGWRGVDPFKQVQGAVGGTGGGDQGEEAECQRSLFVDPLMWMKGKINDTSGKLHCPKCDIKIGSYVWYGEKCPCGSWVAPAFHIDVGKVDKIPFQSVAPTPTLRTAPTPRMESASSGFIEAHDPSTEHPPPTGPGGVMYSPALPPSTHNKTHPPVVAAVAPLVSSSSVTGGHTASGLMEVETASSSTTSVLPPAMMERMAAASSHGISGQAGPSGNQTGMMDVDS